MPQTPRRLRTPAREGAELSLSTLADQIGAIAAALAPLHALIAGPGTGPQVRKDRSSRQSDRGHRRRGTDLMQRLAKMDGMGALALRFAILTASRSGEVRGATWGEMDLGAAVWTIPAERMKGRETHRVPLAQAALDVLSEARLSIGAQT